jgi:hypothetical protein
VVRRFRNGVGEVGALASRWFIFVTRVGTIGFSVPTRRGILARDRVLLLVTSVTGLIINRLTRLANGVGEVGAFTSARFIFITRERVIRFRVPTRRGIISRNRVLLLVTSVASSATWRIGSL